MHLQCLPSVLSAETYYSDLEAAIIFSFPQTPQTRGQQPTASGLVPACEKIGTSPQQLRELAAGSSYSNKKDIPRALLPPSLFCLFSLFFLLQQRKHPQGPST